MGLLQRALETYDNNENIIGKMEPNKVPLEPIGHITVTADVEITLDSDGNFECAKLLEEKEKIIIPITDSSVARSGKAVNDNIHPHMLCDQLSFLGGDSNLCKVYLNQLEEWINSEFSHPLLKVVYKYVASNKIVTDINQMLESTKKKLDHKWMVRWVINLDGKPIECWKSKELINNYSDYYISRINNSGYKENLCMITGNVAKVIDNNNHRKGIIPSCGGNAKLLSANDTSYFTYRGRFKNDVEAVTVSAIDLVKANNALKWLADNQGVSMKYGNVTYLFWKPEGIKLKVSPFDAMLGYKTEIQPSNYKKDLYEILMSYKEANSNLSNVVIACFGAATTGRLSINYYSEFLEPDYYSRLASWDNSCYWWLFNYKSKKYEVTTPDLNSIAIYAFGTYRKDSSGQKGKLELKEKILGKRVQELFQCRINKSKIPYIYVKGLINNVGKLDLFKDDVITKRYLLFITCAVLQKYYIDNNKGEFNMEKIETERNDISYHYGRLLAILEKIERDTYSDEDKRSPNAIRLQSKFIQNPLTTFRKIYEKLNAAYIPKLTTGSQAYYKKIIADVVADLERCEGYADLMDKPLQSTYIIGYFMQNKELYSRKDKKQELEEE